jgi:acetylornithine deacetylase/succinyl-diaminopimelate desuccinylase-like protein
MLVSSVTAGCVTSNPVIKTSADGGCPRFVEVDPPYEQDPSRLDPALLLSAYLRIDTSRPRGCEESSARFWKKFFDRYGIENQIITHPFGAGRASFIARTRSRPKDRPLILHNYMDVAAVNPARWSVPPFGGLIEGDFTRGRGALEMKATAVTQAIAMARSVVEKWPIKRDIIFLASADGGGDRSALSRELSGVEWLLKNKRSLFDNAQYVWGSGGYIAARHGKPYRWEVSTAEKARLELTMSYKGESTDVGEINLEMAQAAWEIMTKFSRNIEIEDPGERERVLQDPVVRANYETTHALTRFAGAGTKGVVSGEVFAEILFTDGAARRTALEAAIRRALLAGVGVADIRQRNGDLYVKLRAIGPTTDASAPPLNGGAAAQLAGALVTIRDRVVMREMPAKGVRILRMGASDESHPDSEIVFDFRLMPGESRDKILAEINKLISGFKARVSVTAEAVLAPASSTDTPFFAALTAAHEKFSQGTRTAPSIETPVLVSSSDSSVFRKAGMVVYGFEPILYDPNERGTIENDEKISIKSLRGALDVTQFILRDFLTAR